MDFRDLSGFRPEIFAQYLTPVPAAQNRHIRRSLDRKGLPLDYFDVLNVPDAVIETIFRHLQIHDLLSAMSTCQRFYRIGESSKLWKRLHLTNITIGQFALHRLLERGATMVNLSRATIFKDNLNYPPDGADPLDKLMFLDLSYVVYSGTSVLDSILKRVTTLKFLHIGQFPAINGELCEYIARNRDLDRLNMEMCKEFTADGLTKIFESCDGISELNLGWTTFEQDALKEACRKLPTNLERLNLAGVSQLDDEIVERITDRCKFLVEIDFSDCMGVTGKSIEHINNLDYLKKLSLCRCYTIEPFHYATIKEVDELNLHGNLTDDSIDYLRRHLPLTLVNDSALSSIARPSFQRFHSYDS